MTNALKNDSNIIIDANAHAKRIEEIKDLLKANRSRHAMVKIFLQATEETLRDRIRNRKPIHGYYQGTERDLEASLSSSKINPEDYDLTVDVDKMSDSEVFELINHYIRPLLSKESSEDSRQPASIDSVISSCNEIS